MIAVRVRQYHELEPRGAVPCEQRTEPVPPRIAPFVRGAGVDRDPPPSRGPQQRAVSLPDVGEN